MLKEGKKKKEEKNPHKPVFHFIFSACVFNSLLEYKRQVVLQVCS